MSCAQKNAIELLGDEEETIVKDLIFHGKMKLCISATNVRL